jgi:gluconolactonase
MIWAMVLTVVAADPSGLVAGDVVTIAEDYEFTEGPVWLRSGELVFSDIPADTNYREDHSVFRKPSGKSNGLTLDVEGRLIACEHWNRRVSRTEKDGSITVMAETFEGKKLNSPNDAIVRGDGTIYFTDPPYGLEGREPDLEFSGVYSIAPDGKVSLLVKDFNRPNGIGLSPDQKTLYVSDVAKGHIRSFPVNDDGSIDEGKIHCDVQNPDGMAVDEKGNIWTSSRQGIQVFDPEGNHLTTIEFPQVPANCGFGGEDNSTLYVTARTGLYKIECNVKGLKPGSW